jgi:hypothetical protein
MRKLLWFGSALIVFAVAGSLRAQNNQAQQTITLYSPLQYQHDFSRSSVDLERAAYAPRNRFGDMGYGFGRIGTEVDWFESDAAHRGRSMIVDLGKHAWTDSFRIPVVAALKPGDTMGVFVNANGADGKDGKDGYGAGNGDGLSALPSTGPDQGYPTESPRRPKRPAGVQTSANLLRAVLDHIYVIHVVDDRRDFYALFRVEALQRGDNCTISWKMIPPPPQPTTVKK